jgi:hypothetical protein
MITALVEGELTILDSKHPGGLSPADKRALHADPPAIRCAGCKGRAHIKNLVDGPDPFMIFAHNPGEAERCRALGYHTDESVEHGMLKSALAQAARDAGWSVDVEVFGNNCRADVLAVDPKTNASRVLEAQVSHITAADVHDRTQRYIDNFGGRVTWTHQGPRGWANRSKDVEALRVDDDLSIVVDGVALDQTGLRAPAQPIEAVIPRILRKELRYVFLESFGFYLDLAASSGSTARRLSRQRISPHARGKYVQECERHAVIDLEQSIELREIPDPAKVSFVETLPKLTKAAERQVVLALCGLFNGGLRVEYPDLTKSPKRLRAQTHTHHWAPCDVCGEAMWLPTNRLGVLCEMTARCRGRHWPPNDHRSKPPSLKATCDTCRETEAAYVAIHRHEDERWLCCRRCRAQAERCGTPVRFEAIHVEKSA